MFRYYIRYSFYFYLLISILYIPGHSFAQSLPVGTPVLEDALRRAQLLGDIDSSISFTSMPLFPVASLKLKNCFDPDGSLEKDRGTHSDGIIRFSGNSGI